MSLTSAQSARRLLVPTVALALLPALVGCGGEPTIGEEPLVRGTPTLGPTGSSATSEAESPSDKDETFSRIDDRVARTYFPRPPRELRRWESTQVVTDVGRSVVRAAFPCASGFLDLGVDSSILAHAETVRRDGDFLVSQQLTVYPVGSRAGRFAGDLAEQPHLCDELREGAKAKRVVGYTSTEFGPDRFFGVEDRSTLFAESAVHRAEAPDSYLVDVVTVRGNAVVWTRIASERRVRDQVIAAKDRNPAWVETVRSQGNRGVRALAGLTSTRR